MYRKLAVIVLASLAIASTAGCGEVTTTDARKTFVAGLNADDSFPCKLTRISPDMRKVRMICTDKNTADAAAAVARVCESFDRMDMRQIRIDAVDGKQKCVVADDCACQ